MTTVVKLTLSELKRILPFGCKSIDCCKCPFNDNALICDELMYLFHKYK